MSQWRCREFPRKDIARHYPKGGKGFLANNKR
jgi:hypothetical protein